MQSSELGNPDWKADDKTSAALLAPLIQCPANQLKKNEGQAPEQVENPVRCPLSGIVFGVRTYGFK